MADEWMNDYNYNRLHDALNTLAQSGTGKLHSVNCNPEITVNGNDTLLSDKRVLQGKVKRKSITQSTTLKLIDVAKKKG